MEGNQIVTGHARKRVDALTWICGSGRGAWALVATPKQLAVKKSLFCEKTASCVRRKPLDGMVPVLDT